MKQVLKIALVSSLIFFHQAWVFASIQGRAYLGIYSGNMSEEKAELLGFDNAYGSYISRVIPGSAAEKAGLQVFDYVYGIDDLRTSEEEDLTDLLEGFHPGDEVTVHYWRDGKRRELQVTLGERSNWELTPSASSKAFLGISPHDDEEDDEMGVVVTVVRNSTADSLGLEDGDLLLSINGHPMIDWSDVRMAMAEMENGELIKLEYEREGKRRKAEGNLGAEKQATSYSAARMPYLAGMQQEEAAFMGVQSNNISKDKARLLNFDNAFGSYVSRVYRNSAAERAGIRPFDYIFGVDEYRTGADQSLTQILRKFKAGDKATLHLYRQNKRETVAITFGRRSEASFESRPECEQPFLGVRHDHQVNPERGVSVTIIEKSTAGEAGLENGDVITTINGNPIIDWEDITIAVNSLDVGEKVRLDYQREGKKLSGSAPLKSRCETRSTNTYETRPPVYSYNYSRNSEKTAPRLAASETKIELQEAGAGEVEELKAKSKQSINSRNDLKVNNLRLQTGARGAQVLEFTLPQGGETTVQVLNSSGRQIYNYELGNFSGEFSDEIDLGQNGAGNYFLEIRQEGKSLLKKIVLSRK